MYSHYPWWYTKPPGCINCVTFNLILVYLIYTTYFEIMGFDTGEQSGCCSDGFCFPVIKQDIFSHISIDHSYIQSHKYTHQWINYWHINFDLSIHQSVCQHFTPARWFWYISSTGHIFNNIERTNFILRLQLSIWVWI